MAVEGVETDDGRPIVLFTTEPITLREANALLHQAGFRGVMRLDEVRRVERVPVLGAGKTDYRRLRAMIAAADGAAVGTTAGTGVVGESTESPCCASTTSS